MRPVDMLYWVRFSLAIIIGVISGTMSFTGMVTPSTAFIPLIIVVAAYAATYYAAKFLMRITPDKLPKRRDMVLTGLFPYIVGWFTFWVLAFTLLRVLAG